MSNIYNDSDNDDDNDRIGYDGRRSTSTVEEDDNNDYDEDGDNNENDDENDENDDEEDDDENEDIDDIDDNDDNDDDNNVDHAAKSPSTINNNDLLVRRVGNTDINQTQSAFFAEWVEDYGKYTFYDDEVVLGDVVPALKVFFMEGLRNTIRILGGDPNILLVGWSCVVIRRQKGLFNGLLDTIYIHEIDEKEVKRCRFRLEVAVELGLAQPKNSTKSLPGHEMQIMANEFREKFLVSQLIEAHGNRKYDIVRDHDNIRVVDSSSQSRNFHDVRFSLGNITVLSWGKVVSTPGFHTSTQIFPLGFKCIRQEHDTLLNKIVDCYCEVDSITEIVTNNGKVVENINPLFRVTLAWQLESGKTAVRVYEGRSPQQAWQSAMLETLGQQAHHMKDVETGPNFLLISLNDAKKANEEADTDANFSMEVDQEIEAFDEEEQTLRAEIRDQRRGYFRALRHEQSLGLHAAVKPRLLLDTVENFADESLMRLIEGMEGADRCANYQFTDAREKDTRRKLFICKSFNRVFAKVKGLDKVLSKDAPRKKLKKLKGGNGGARLKRAPGGGRKPAGVPARGRATKADILATKQQQDQFEASIEQRNQTRKKIKDVERKVKELKDNIRSIVKKRRDEAKLRVEINCAKEEKNRKKKEMVSDKSPSHDAEAIVAIEKEKKSKLLELQIPEPSSGFMCLDGEVFSSIVELWNFLQTFSNVIGLEFPPHPEKLINDIKSVDNDYKILNAGKRLSTMGLCEFIGDRPTIQVNDSLEYLNEIGILLCSSLERDLKKCMGIDLLDIPREESDLPINRFTWKEICRILLLSSACKELGMNDTDLSTFIKGGRGNTLAPEGMDIKTVRVLRRRISFHTEVLREENQESLYGFNAGLCVRIPCPGPYRDKNISSTIWKQFLASLTHIPDEKAWMIYDIIDTVITICKCADDEFVKEMASKLDCCIKAPIFSISNGSMSKKEALQLLDSFQIEELKAENEDNEKMDIEPTLEKIETVVFLNSTEFQVDPIPLTPFSLWNQQKNQQARHAIGVDSNDSDFVEMDEDNEKEDDYENPKSHSSPSAVKETQLSIALNDEEEFARASLLTLASQRCYLVIRDLMLNPIAYSFCNPVKMQDAPLYSKTISNRLCFADIKRHLLNGGYENAILNFYTDVNLVFENAMAFNPDFTQITHYAHKLLGIFERMFMEFVLYVDSPLPCMDACHICRSMDEPVVLQTGGAKCERCEALYHLDCLDPPLLSNPRQEWYCPFCIEQKGVATVHPNNTAKVIHPDHPTLSGEVVGIEQIKQTLRFVIEFGTCREMWSGNKVRKNYAPAAENSTNPKDAVLELPQGYNYDDYDAVCGLARGYHAWGASQHMIPSYISPQYSLEAYGKKKIDPFFESCCDAVAALGHLVDPAELGSQEWTTILNAMMKRALASSYFNEATAKLEAEIGPAIKSSFTKLQNGNSVSYDTLVRKPSKFKSKVKGEYNDVVDDSDEDDVEKGKNRPRLGRPKKKDQALNALKEQQKVKPSPKPVDDVQENEENKVNNDDISTESESIASVDEMTDDDFDFGHEEQEVKVVSNTFAQWDNRLLSRKRGREEALLVQHSILDVFKDPDFIEEINKDTCSPIFDSVIRACAVKPADGLDTTDWCSAWGKKMDYFAANALEETKSPTLCQFCGYDEHYIANPFVMAHTWVEWDEDRNDNRVAEENKIWLPHDPEDAVIEKKECSLQTRRALRPGSCIAHEMCADHMNYMRSVLYDRHGLHDYRDQIEVIVGVGRAKSTPVGTDRHGRLYWLLAGLPGIFVSTNDKVDKIKAFSDNFAKGADKFLKPAQSKSVIWRIYNCEFEIGKLARWLDTIFPEERQLKKVIDWLFPNCLNAVAESSKTMTLTSPLNEINSKVNEIDDDDDIEEDRSSNRIRKRVIESDDEYGNKNEDDDEETNTEDDEEWDDEPKSKRSRLDKERTSVRCEMLRLKKETEQDEYDGAAKYRPDQRIVVENKQNKLLWEARILEVKVIENDKHLYKVRFDKWGPAYDRWISEESIKSNRQAAPESKGRSKQKVSRDIYAEEHTDNIPKCLNSLRAAEYLEAEYRESIRDTLKLSFSDTTTDMDYIRYALLIVEAALPCGSLEISDDKWGDEFAICWREAVMAASDATSLMGCVIMLEYCIKGTWTTTCGNKILACLPTRTQALKTATISQCALRLWLVDGALRYDKFITPEEKLSKSKKKTSSKRADSSTK